MQLEVKHKCLYDSVAVLDMSATVIEVLASGHVETIPKTLDHFIGAVFVVMPRREDELGAGVAESLEKVVLILLRPTVVIVYIASEVGWVAVDDVVWLGPFYGLYERYIVEFPGLLFDDAGYVLYLVANLSDVGGSKAVGFFAEWDVPVTVTVESHHSIEASTGEEDEIVGTMFPVKAIAHLAKVCIPILIGICEQFALPFKVGSHGIRSDVATLYAAIKVDDVWIGVAYDMGTAHG